MTHITQEQAVELARDSDLDWHAGYLLDDERDNRYHTLCNAAIDWYIAQQAAPAAREPLSTGQYSAIQEQLSRMDSGLWSRGGISERTLLNAIWEAAHGIGTQRDGV